MKTSKFVKLLKKELKDLELFGVGFMLVDGEDHALHKEVNDINGKQAIVSVKCVNYYTDTVDLLCIPREKKGKFKKESTKEVCDYLMQMSVDNRELVSEV